MVGTKLLIIRFSSFGDILQALQAPCAFARKFPDAQIHWVTRSDFAETVGTSPFVHKVWSFQRTSGVIGLLRLAANLRRENYTHIYDAHSNLRSRILSILLQATHFVRRPKERWKRFLQFTLGFKQFPVPYPGSLSYLLPLEAWGVEAKFSAPTLKIDGDLLSSIQKRIGLNSPYVTLAPSAAWEMKRWPVSHWKALIQKLQTTNIVLLGGPADSFIQELALTPHVINTAGKLSLMESMAVIAGSQALVSADTGLLHAADQMNIPAIALIGPTAFGYPSNPRTKTLEVELPCKPCSKDGRGRCKNSVYQKCMLDIAPDRVLTALQGAFR